jgi:hypothetical protein
MSVNKQLKRTSFETTPVPFLNMASKTTLYYLSAKTALRAIRPFLIHFGDTDR